MAGNGWQKNSRGESYFPEGRQVVNTVVILDHESKNIEGYRRMLEASREQIDCEFFQYPEKALDYVKSHPTAVLISELAMPVMSGKEVFDMVEMLSPSTVRIAMTQMDSVAETLEIFNQIRIFKLILKPFFLPEDLINPIQQALEYHKELEQEELRIKKMEQERLRLDQLWQQLTDKLEKKKNRYKGIYQVASGIIRGNLNSEMKGLNAQEAGFAAEVCEELLQEFMRYYMFEEHDWQFHVRYLQVRFSYPEDGCILQIKNNTGSEAPREILPEIAYGIFLGGYLCQMLFYSYRTLMLVEKEGSVYVLRMFCQHSSGRKSYKITDEGVRNLMINFIREIAKALSFRMASGVKEQKFAVRLYFRKEDGCNECDNYGAL
jgi:DNA-binding NarL/FixJ family response regulator